MRLDKNNIYFLPPDNKNGLSTLPPNNLYLSDTFEFRVRFTIDIKECKDKDCGVIMMNGKHLGIRVYNDYLSASVWTQNGIYEKQFPLDIENIWCRFICDNKNKQISLITDTQSSTIDFDGDLVDDYKYSYLWVGCGNGFNEPDDEFRNNFFGDISYLEIKKDDKTLFKSNFEKKTNFKVFEKSGISEIRCRYRWYYL